MQIGFVRMSYVQYKT